jgi:hypothetical protein
MVMQNKEYKISDKVQPDVVAEPAVAYNAMSSSIEDENLTVFDGDDSPLPLPLEKYHTLAEFKAKMERLAYEKLGLKLIL